MNSQLTLFPGLVPTPAVAAEDEPAPVVLSGQLHLFEGEAAHIQQIATLLDQGLFDQAMGRLRSLEAARFPDAGAWCALLTPVLEAIAAAEQQPGALAAIAEEWEGQPTRRGLPLSLTWATTRGLHRITAEAADVGAVVLDRPAGWHWMRAGRPEEARRSLEASVEGNRLPGTALVMIGNIVWRAGDPAVARTLYCEAFLRDPMHVPIADIADEATRDLVDLAREEGLTPPEAWAPLIGFAAEHFPALSRSSVDETVARFQSTLALSREATRHGSPDVRLRKDLKLMAPALFERLRDSGRA